MISIIVPFDKDRGYLGEALNSIHQQTYRDFEIILSHSDNSGGYNMNRGIEKAKGEYIIFLCEDDLLTKDSLKDRVDFLEVNDCDFIHSRGEYLHEDGSTSFYGLTNPYVQFNSCLESNGIHGGTVMYKAELFKEFKWNEELWTGGEWEFNLQLLHANKRLGFLDKVTYLYRLHSEQKSIGNLNNDYQAKRNKVKQQIRDSFK